MTEFPYQIIDLTHTLDELTPSWDSSCGFKCQLSFDYADCDTHVQFRVQEIKMPAGIGTHMDAPAHCIPNGTTIDQLPLSKFLAPCNVINISESAHEYFSLLPQDIAHFESSHGSILPGSFVMVQTGWEQFWSDQKKYRNNYIFPSVSAEAAIILLKKGVCGLGIDTLSPDRPEDGYPVHQLFLSNGKYLIENAANLANLPAQGSFILALPIKIRDATEAPIRLIGLINKIKNEVKD
ncbi:MAG: cyclase family protein [Tatlockia sp.]|nr:cyclase family protein [Tatlockia sp.]